MISKSLVLFVSLLSVQVFAVCYEGEFRIKLAEDKFVKFSFRVNEAADGASARFTSQVLNPDDEVTEQGGTVADHFKPDDMVLAAVKGHRCPCVEFESANKDVKFFLESLTDGSVKSEFTYSHYPVNLTNLGLCK